MCKCVLDCVSECWFNTISASESILISDVGSNFQVGGGGAGRKTANYTACVGVCGYGGGGPGADPEGVV